MITKEWDGILDGLYKLDLDEPYLEATIEKPDAPIEKTEFDAESGKTQDRDEKGRYTDEGKGAPGTTVQPRLPGMTRPTSQPKLPGFTPLVPHHAEEFYSPSTATMTFDEAVKALHGDRQKAALEVTHDVDFQLGLNAKPLDAVGDWADGAENSVINQISNLRDFDELRYSAALKGKQLHQKAVLAFEEDRKGPDSLLSMTFNTNNLDEIRKAADQVGLKNKTLVPEGNQTHVTIFEKGDNAMAIAKMKDMGIVLSKYLPEGEVKLTQIKGRGEFVGEADTRKEAGKNYDKIIADYEAKFPGRRHYEHAAGPGDYGDRSKVAEEEESGRAAIKAHLIKDAADSTKDLHNGIHGALMVTFKDGHKGVFKMDEGAATQVEAAYSDLADVLKLDDIVPVTVIRDLDVAAGPKQREIHYKKGSMQDFVPGNDASLLGHTERYDGQKDLARAAAFDFAMLQTDRHAGNWRIDNKGKMQLTDNGFGLGAAGHWISSRIFGRAKNDNLDVPDEAKKWIDKWDKINNVLDSRGLSSEANGVKKRLESLKAAVKFKDLKQ